MNSIIESLADFHLVFLPLLVAIDPVAIIPFYTAFTNRMAPERRRRVLRIALLTATVVGIVFLLTGRAIFAVLGIEVHHFVLAGGTILFILSIRELLATGGEEPVEPDELLAVVPIGTPLLAGPATISLLLVLSALYPFWLVVVAFIACIGVAWVALLFANRIAAVMGKGGLQAFIKVMYLLLAAIAVKLITDGVVQTIEAVNVG